MPRYNLFCEGNIVTKFTLLIVFDYDPMVSADSLEGSEFFAIAYRLHTTIAKRKG